MPPVARRPAKTPTQPPALDTVIAPLVEGEAARAMGQELERVTLAFVDTAVVSITDAASYGEAGEFLKQLAAKRRQVVEYFAPLKAMANKLHKAICSRENELLQPLAAVDSRVRTAVVAYTSEQERRRREEERRLQEEARKAEEQRLLEEAAALERQGERAMAAAVIEQAATMPAPVVVVSSSVPQVQGISTGARWTWRPVNGDAARAVQLVPREYLTLDEKKLNAYARMHGASAKLPGIEFYDAGKVTVRG